MTLAHALKFAAQLGTASREYLLRHDALERVQCLLDEGVDPEDCVLGVVFQGSHTSRSLGDEFATYIEDTVQQLARNEVPPTLQREFSSNDLVQYVLQSLWTDRHKVTYTTKAQFTKYLKRKIQWRVSDAYRASTAAKRRNDLREPASPEELGLRETRRGPHTDAAAKDDALAIAGRIQRMPTRQHEVVCRLLKGEPVTVIAEALGTSTATVYKTIKDAQRMLV